MFFEENQNPLRPRVLLVSLGRCLVVQVLSNWGPLLFLAGFTFLRRLALVGLITLEWQGARKVALESQKSRCPWV